MSKELPTLVMGASLKVDRYSNRAIHALRQHGHPVVAVGLREGRVDDVLLVKAIPQGTQVDTVTMYLNAENQSAWEDELIGLRPRRIIFNPGAENPAFAKKAEVAGIETLEACTLVMLSTGQF
ncbi:MAG: CoA-binding protein [Flavobacteriales bacterium]|nr:CoA-binding protein [Flavobacteriales bacterium]MBK9059501.1 CoA-binding protein [Flavobacteriales bacterium]MBK9598130.1 CoA-binding protein [Flavobacteriales bacterium]QQS73560.1 MAG: CoA-binding protein [Flavobacteriales bacterium]HQV37296.1 CoA-binding protein [Flavobacteriales bacterium]